jgi:2-succinyl-5-enolpyruvyl-6-hydroxy-3-cyclohexene-1-carboxylate synthase
MGRKISASRGLNGIDGQLSTFFGMLDADRENCAILGDLTTLYDLNAPWILAQLRQNIANWRLIIINNSGGRIFDRLFGKPIYLNAHQVRFGDWCHQWGLSYLALSSQDLADASKLTAALQPEGPRVIELTPDAQATAQFWNTWESSK